MEQYKLEAKAHFYANSIDDAFRRLSKHFASLAEQGLDASELFVDGSIVIEPTNDRVIKVSK